MFKLLNLHYLIKTAGVDDIYCHLKACNDNFIPPLDTRVELMEYTNKLVVQSITFEAWNDKLLVGLIAVYFNQMDINGRKIGYVSNVSTMLECAGQGIATQLMIMCLKYATQNKVNEISLEVNSSNIIAIGLYKKLGFVELNRRQHAIEMKIKLPD